MRRFRHQLAALAGAVALLAAAGPAASAGGEDFYKGRNVSLIIGYSVGGGYDLYARVLAAHIGHHIPGQPTIVPQNMTGAGSLRAANYLYSVAPKDGSAFGTFSRSMAVAPLFQDAKFDATKFTWLGSVTNEVSLCVSWHTSPTKTWADMVDHPFTFGGQGAGSDPDIFALLYKNVFGAKLKLVSGYPGTSDNMLAMERGEIEGLCGISWGTLKTRYGDWLANKQINLLVQAGLHQEPELPQVPFAADLTRTDEQRQILRLVIASQGMARPFAAPPDLPADRKAALIDAFAATMKDEGFLAEAEKMKLEVNPISPAEIEALLHDVYATPPDIVAKTVKAINN
jgi:tripartite-type tricarboxylate transporter receptor subunit TctC